MSQALPCGSRGSVRRLRGFGLGTLVLLLFGLPAWAGEAARITLTLTSGADGAPWVTALVTDAEGTPVPEASVLFRLRTAFGWLTLEEQSTDASGQARIRLPARVWATEIRAESGDVEGVGATLSVGTLAPGSPRVRPNRDVLRALSPQPALISPGPPPQLVALLALVLGGIWATYGYVAWLLWRIRSSGPSQGSRS